MEKVNEVLKRIIDILGSLFGLILASPIFLISAVAIKLDSKGPVFFRQERLGKDGKVFKIFKFRTMVENAEKMSSGIITFENDPRITRVGDFLRKTSLDELPQLLNVLKGEMSLVGPRPPVPYHPRKYEDYPEHQKRRFKMKPGITGYAQVNGRNNLTWDDRIELDVHYVENFNILLDIKILFLTVIKVLKSEDVHSTDVKKE